MARSSVVAEVIDALVAECADVLPDWTVSDGFPLEAHGGDFLAIGVDDPNATAPAPSARSDIEWAGASRSVGLDESGQVTCALWARRGDAEAKTARDACYDALSLIQTWIRADVTLGGVDGLWSTWLAGTELSQDQTEDGALALLIFRISFKARL